VVREPPGDGPGHWAGAPSALYDEERGRYLLSYRLRRPLAEGRGYETRIAESADGDQFVDVWSAPKSAFQATSIERSALVKTPAGAYRLYVGYVPAATNRWQIDVLEAPAPDRFDPATRRPALRPDDADAEGVKDPYVLLIGGVYFMYVPYGPRASIASGSSEQALHGTGNVFTTGLIAHPTGLATSLDGLRFDWHGDVIGPGGGWDRNMARLACVLYMPPAFVAYYDGRTGQGDVYEDRTGLALGFSPHRFESVTRTAPALVSPHSTGALRYLDIVPVQGRFYAFYEMARPDGAHELRMSVIAAPG
jgi:hypothetical protein